MGKPIIPRVIRGRLYFQTADVLFPTFAQAATAWSAARAHRLGIADEVETLVVERTAALAEMRRAGPDMDRFSAACKSEAELAVRIRQLRGVTSHG
jgi:hypothetical protein